MKKNYHFSTYLLCYLPIVFICSSCGTNPVTGKSELTIVSEREEIAIGEQYFPLLTQAEGGEYIVDLSVEEYVQKVGKKLAAVSDRPDLPYEFGVVDNTTANAWALPGGKISIYIGLLVYLENEAELAAVLAHEIVHSAARHTALAIQRDMLIQGGLMGLSSATSGSSYGDAIMQGAGIGAGLITTKYSRSAELEADKYGIKYMQKAGYDPSAAVTLQEKFVKLNEQRSSHWIDGLFATHPPSEERVVANQLSSSSYPEGGYLGQRPYQNVMSRLKKVWPAYEALDRGYKLLLRGDPEAALEQAEKAISIEPKEGHFYNLKGKALVAMKNYQMALRAFDTAIDKNSNYFDFYLQRGLLKKMMGEDGRLDLRKSFKLLPTQQAYEALGGAV